MSPYVELGEVHTYYEEDADRQGEPLVILMQVRAGECDAGMTAS